MDSVTTDSMSPEAEVKALLIKSGPSSSSSSSTISQSQSNVSIATGSKFHSIDAILGTRAAAQEKALHQHFLQNNNNEANGRAFFDQNNQSGRCLQHHCDPRVNQLGNYIYLPHHHQNNIQSNRIENEAEEMRRAMKRKIKIGPQSPLPGKKLTLKSYPNQFMHGRTLD